MSATHHHHCHDQPLSGCLLGENISWEAFNDWKVRVVLLANYSGAVAVRGLKERNYNVNYHVTALHCARLVIPKLAFGLVTRHAFPCTCRRFDPCSPLGIASYNKIRRGRPTYQNVLKRTKCIPAENFVHLSSYLRMSILRCSERFPAFSGIRNMLALI
jgi:hypothetical protein